MIKIKMQLKCFRLLQTIPKITDCAFASLQYKKHFLVLCWIVQSFTTYTTFYRNITLQPRAGRCSPSQRSF